MILDAEKLGISRDEIGVILVDHGSRLEASNNLLLEVVKAFRSHTQWQIIEPAHMELAEPSIGTAFANCANQGAKVVIVFPYFLAPGRHWSQDIPALAAQACQAYPDIKHLVTAPLGLHELMFQIINERISTCIQHATSAGPACEICKDSDGCTLR